MRRFNAADRMAALIRAWLWLSTVARTHIRHTPSRCVLGWARELKVELLNYHLDKADFELGRECPMGRDRL